MVGSLWRAQRWVESCSSSPFAILGPCQTQSFNHGNHDGTEPYPKSFSPHFRSNLTLSSSPPFAPDSSSKSPVFLERPRAVCFSPACETLSQGRAWLSRGRAWHVRFLPTVPCPVQFLPYKITLLLLQRCEALRF